MGASVRFWHRTDVEGLERSELAILSRGFEADLVMDAAGPALRYEYLFERAPPPA